MVLNYSEEKTHGIIEFLKGEEGFGKILDIGCNEGNIVDYLKINKKNYFGIDVDKDALIKAKDKNLNGRYVDLNKNKIPFKKNSFDTILALDIIEHILEPEQIFKEISRLLKKNGKVLISLPNDYYIINFLRMILLDKPILFENSVAKKRTHIHFFTIKISKRLVSKYFKIEKIKYFGNSISVPFLNQKIKNILANLSPRFFASNVFFLVSKR